MEARVSFSSKRFLDGRKRGCSMARMIGRVLDLPVQRREIIALGRALQNPESLFGSKTGVVKIGFLRCK